MRLTIRPLELAEQLGFDFTVRQHARRTKGGVTTVKQHRKRRKGRTTPLTPPEGSGVSQEVWDEWLRRTASMSEDERTRWIRERNAHVMLPWVSIGSQSPDARLRKRFLGSDVRPYHSLTPTVEKGLQEVVESGDPKMSRAAAAVLHALRNKPADLRITAEDMYDWTPAEVDLYTNILAPNVSKRTPLPGGHWGAAEASNPTALGVAWLGDGRPMIHNYNDVNGEGRTRQMSWQDKIDAMRLRAYAQHCLAHIEHFRMPTYYRGLGLPADIMGSIEEQLSQGGTPEVRLTGCTAFTPERPVAAHYATSSWTRQHSEGDAVPVILELARTPEVDNTIQMYHPDKSRKWFRTPEGRVIQYPFEVLTSARGMRVVSMKGRAAYRLELVEVGDGRRVFEVTGPMSKKPERVTWTPDQGWRYVDRPAHRRQTIAGRFATRLDSMRPSMDAPVGTVRSLYDHPPVLTVELV